MTQIPSELYYQYTPLEIENLHKQFQFGVQEWADAPSINLCKCCKNDCLYCYARWEAYRRGRIDDWAKWKDMQLIDWKAEKTFSKSRAYKRIMFPTTHDIVIEQPIRQACIDFITKQLCQRQLEVLITTKPHLDVIKEICETFDVDELACYTKKGKKMSVQNPKEKIAFRFTICSTNPEKLALLEPGAPPLSERVEALKYATNAGFATSISCEPLLDKDPEGLINLLSPYLSPTNRKHDIGVIWVGFLNPYAPVAMVEKVYGKQCAKLYQDAIDYGKFENVFEYYRKFCHDPRVKFKETIKRMMVAHNVWVEDIHKWKYYD